MTAARTATLALTTPETVAPTTEAPVIDTSSPIPPDSTASPNPSATGTPAAGTPSATVSVTQTLVSSTGPITGTPTLFITGTVTVTAPSLGSTSAVVSVPISPTMTLASPTKVPTPKLPLVTLGACATIWEPGYYKLTGDIKTPEYDCFYIQSNNVVFDCDNHTIEGNNYQGYGINVRKWGFPFQQTPTNVEIKNCKVLRHRTGIFVGGANNVNIHNNTLSDNLDTVDKQRFGIFLGMTEGGGLRLDTVDGGIVEYNTTEREAIGIDARDSNNLIIRNNNANSNSAWGISLLNVSYSQVVKNTTRDNIRYCAWGDGTVGRGCDAGGIILQDGASYDLVAENTVAGDNGNGIFIKSHGSRCGSYNEIRNNKITDAVYNAIEFSFCTGNRVVGNTISGSYDAIWFGFSSNTQIRDNVISNMNNHGIISYNSRDSTVANNRITNSREGIYFYWDTWDPKRFYFLTPTPDNYASKNNVIQNNFLQDNQVAGVHLTNSTQNRVQGNTFVNNGRPVWTEGKGDGNFIGSAQ